MGASQGRFWREASGATRGIPTAPTTLVFDLR